METENYFSRVKISSMCKRCIIIGIVFALFGGWKTSEKNTCLLMHEIETASYDRYVTGKS